MLPVQYHPTFSIWGRLGWPAKAENIRPTCWARPDLANDREPVIQGGTDGLKRTGPVDHGITSREEEEG